MKYKLNCVAQRPPEHPIWRGNQQHFNYQINYNFWKTLPPPIFDVHPSLPPSIPLSPSLSLFLLIPAPVSRIPFYFILTLSTPSVNKREVVVVLLISVCICGSRSWSVGGGDAHVGAAFWCDLLCGSRGRKTALRYGKYSIKFSVFTYSALPSAVIPEHLKATQQKQKTTKRHQPWG